MSRVAVVLLFCSWLAGCARSGPPAMAPIPASPGLERACRSVYPQGRWQFVHLIEFSMATGAGTVLGVTVLDGDRIHCALTTIEGLTLFEASQGDSLEIQRAVPPFDRPGFGQGLMDDVRALFRPPGPASVRYGETGNGPCCRYRSPDGRLTDIQPGDDGCFRIDTWSADRRQHRTIEAKACRTRQGYRLADRFTLTVSGAREYRLRMTLLDVQPPFAEERNP